MASHKIEWWGLFMRLKQGMSNRFTFFRFKFMSRNFAFRTVRRSYHGTIQPFQTTQPFLAQPRSNLAPAYSNKNLVSDYKISKFILNLFFCRWSVERRWASCIPTVQNVPDNRACGCKEVWRHCDNATCCPLHGTSSECTRILFELPTALPPLV